MRIFRSGQVCARLLLELEGFIKPGIMTKDIDKFVVEYFKSEGVQPAFKGYFGYPASVCVSLDDEIVHGIPGSREIKPGQIVKVDVGAIYQGRYSDTARSYIMEPNDDTKRELLEITEKALWDGIEKCRQGNRIGDISHAIQTTLESKGYSVVRNLTGHGTGFNLHEEPQVLNYGPPHKGPEITDGLVLALEPMASMGSAEILLCEDKWTYRTIDGSLSAHFEHTVAVWKGETYVLTDSDPSFDEKIFLN